MRSILKVSILFLCLLPHFFLSAGNLPKKNIKHILIISAYADSNPWSNNFITPIVTMASQDSTIGAYTINLNMFALQKRKGDVEEFKKSIYERLPTHTPKMVVFIGNASFIFCNNLNKIWAHPIIIGGMHKS